MIVVDSSALVAIMQGEPAGLRIRTLLMETPASVLSAATYVETACVLASRAVDGPRAAVERLEALLRALRIDLAPVDETQARLAVAARLQFGKGFGHRKGLNYGDSFAYALAKARGAPLLYVGDDFARTDVEPALP